MFGKLISLLAQAKGAAVATVFVAGAVTATAGATNPEVQNTVQNVTTSVGTTLRAMTQNAVRSCTDEGQPAVVAQRNAADKLLRDGWNDAHKALTDLRGGKDTDNKAVGDIVKKYSDQLKDTLDMALVNTASLTLGRDGQVRKLEASGSPKPSESPKTSESPKPSCSPKPSGSAAAVSPKPSESPKASGSGKPEDQGRVAVANRTTLNADVQTIVTAALKDFTDLVKKATDEVALVPAPDRGKPSDKPGGKPSDAPGGKPSDDPGNGNKPSNSPGRP